MFGGRARRAVHGHRRRSTGRRRAWLRPVISGITVLSLAGAWGIAGTRHGYPATRPRLMSGAAWLASSQVGQLTLLDGSSAEVAAQVQVANRGEELDAVQQGATAYAVNRTTGTLRRIDGATFEVSKPVSPIPGATDGLRAFAGPGALYVLDGRRGLLTQADPTTLAGRGGPVSLAARVSAQAASIDSGGRLWVLDGETGDLDWIEDGQRHTRRRATAPATGLLTLADGKPVVVDQQSRTAVTLDPDSAAAVHRTNLDLRADDRIEVSGSPHAARLYVVAARGVLAVCELTASTCSGVVPLGTGGAELGTAVESGGRLFVPDYTGGRVWIVDLSDLHVVAQPQVLPSGTRFQLLTRDNVVFFNDPRSEHAGVIRLDGGVRPVAKYNPGNPDAGLTAPGAAKPPAGVPPPGIPPPGKPPVTKPAPPPPGKPQSPRPPNPNPNPNPAPTPSDSPSPTPSRSTQPPVPDLRITVSANPSLVNQNVTLNVQALTAPQPVSAQWSFGDGATGSGLSVNHAWTAVRTFMVSVTATFPDGRTNIRSISQEVRAQPPVMGTLTVTTIGPGHIVSSPSGINCPSRCSAQFVAGTAVTLTARPDLNSQFEEYDGACLGATPPECQLTITAAGASVTGTFTKVTNFHDLTLNITNAATAGGGGVVDVRDNAGSSLQCVDAQCVYGFIDTATVTLTRNEQGLPGWKFDHWSGACNTRNISCTVSMVVNRTVTAVFVRCSTPCAPTGGVAPAAGPLAPRLTSGRTIAARRRRRW